MAKWFLRHAFPKILLCLVAAAIGTAIPTGCGKKGPPELPDVKAPIGVSDLSVTVEGGDIVLSWTATAAQNEASGVEGYLIYRSAEPLSNDDCEGCPVLFKRGAKVPLVEKDSTRPLMNFKERLLPATRYRFKVVPYDAQGQLGPDSNIVRIVTD
jgi:predicted small lipoprotein YifL